MTHRTYIPLIFVTLPVAVTWINTAAAAWRDLIVRALRYWNELSPLRPGLVVGSEREITMPITWGKWDWMMPVVPRRPLQIVVVASTPGQTWDLGNGARSCGYYAASLHACVATTSGWAGDPDSLGVTVTHELGHALYGLPDRPDDATSIMSYGEAAYRAWRLADVDRQWISGGQRAGLAERGPCYVEATL